MSILKQNYTIECYNGDTCDFFGDIHTMVEGHREYFRLICGTHFNFRPAPINTNKYDDNGFYICYLTLDMYNMEEHDIPFYELTTQQKTLAIDCQYIIYDSFGRAVHPDVIYRAYIAEYGKLKPVLSRSFKRHDAKIRGSKRVMYANPRSMNVKSKLVSLSISNQKLDNAPKIRNGAIEFIRYTCSSCYDNMSYTHVEKNWKRQSTVKKQWAKKLKGN